MDFFSRVKQYYEVLQNVEWDSDCTTLSENLLRDVRRCMESVAEEWIFGEESGNEVSN